LSFGLNSDVVVDNPGGVTLLSDLMLNGDLVLLSGNVTTGAATLWIVTGGTVSRTSGHIVGNLKRGVPVSSGPLSMTFDIGDNARYAPFEATFASVSTAGALTVSTTGSDHPAILVSDLDDTRSVNRYWDVTNSGIAFATCDAILNFDPLDVDDGTDLQGVAVGRYETAAWSLPEVGTRTATRTQALGLTSFGAFVIAAPSMTTPTLVSFERSEVGSASARLIWYAAGTLGVEATVYRRQENSPWLAVGTVTPDGTGRYDFEDLQVDPGARYGYRLGVQATVETYYGEAWVQIPALRRTLAVEGLRPNPSSNRLSVSFTLPATGATTLELIDISGRTVLARDAGVRLPGPHVLAFDTARLPAGVYMVRLRQGTCAVSAKAIVTH
jgi:hypothetical protein